jgi:hypothetical protein
MKLKHLIKEATAPIAEYPPVTEADVKSMCDVTGTITIRGGTIVDVAGDVTLKATKTKTLKQLPFKFGTVGNFDAQDALRLESLVNFPDSAETIEISMNMGMKSLAGGENVRCVKFVAVGTSLESFEGCPSANGYDLSENASITSSAGIPTDRIGGLNLAKCPNLTDVRNVVSPTANKQGAGAITWNPNLPLIGLILLAKQPNRISFEIIIPPSDGKLTTIYRDYKGKGLGYAIELADELRNKGYEGNCKF